MDFYDNVLYGFVCGLIGFVVGVVTTRLVQRTDFKDWGEPDEHETMHGLRHDYADPTGAEDLPDYLKRQAE